MLKRTVNGELKEYTQDAGENWKQWAKEWLINWAPPNTEPNLECSCGCKIFFVTWWDYPFTGGYCKVRCAACGEELELINDFA